MSNESYGADLDAEGIPDLEGPAPGKDLTGDGQEGIIPPRDYPQAVEEYGITAAEERTPDAGGGRHAHHRQPVSAT